MKYIKVAVVLTLTLIFSSCMFIGLGEDVKQLKAAITISGKVEQASKNTLPIIVTLNRVVDDKYSVQSYSIVYGDSEFSFIAPDGKYYLLAFEDVNHDFALQENERVGWFGSPSIVSSEYSDNPSGLTVELRDPSIAKDELPELYFPGKAHKPVNIDKTKLGEVVNTSVFRQELGPMGMWEPVKFHLQGHSGIYFLEPYTENKIPVLFVHGISGSGHDWLYLIEHLDRSRFQPWIVQYPSGMRLELLSKTLSESVNELRATHNISNMAVVAHSMGGLVSRGFINDQQTRGDEKLTISTFITISTPWLGHNAASMGVKRAPVAVPSWFDMVPGSPYLTSLHEQSLPSGMEYFLFFSHKGKGGGLTARPNSDGTVSLESQLSLIAQEEAVKIRGYHADHTGVLRNEHVSAEINSILEQELIRN